MKEWIIKLESKKKFSLVGLKRMSWWLVKNDPTLNIIGEIAQIEIGDN